MRKYNVGCNKSISGRVLERVRVSPLLTIPILDSFTLSSSQVLFPRLIVQPESSWIRSNLFGALNLFEPSSNKPKDKMLIAITAKKALRIVAAVLFTEVNPPALLEMSVATSMRMS